VQGRGKTLGAIDIHVAARLRERRMVLGISQPKLAAALGLTFQQVYKYEQAINRISAGRLYELSKVLDVPITFFFEGIADASTPVANLVSGGHTDELGRREAIDCSPHTAPYQTRGCVVVYENLQGLLDRSRTA
jgi:transcriptional regulator with XRE-family HTH domain